MRCVAELFLTLIKAARYARRRPAPALGLCLGARPARAGPRLSTTQISQALSAMRAVLHVAVFLGFHCPARDHRV
jgi:CTP synthase (UTP-ammonia lyase)